MKSNNQYFKNVLKYDLKKSHFGPNLNIAGIENFHIKCVTIITNSKKNRIDEKFKIVKVLVGHVERRCISVTQKIIYMAHTPEKDG